MNKSILAENLKLWMDEKGFNKKSLAVEAGLGETYVHDILRGKSKNPAAHSLEKVAKILGCSLEDLTGAGAREKISITGIFAGLSPDNKRDVVQYAEKLKRLQDLEGGSR